MTPLERDAYNARMAKHANEKVNFLELPVVKSQKLGIWVDYGCASGQTTKFMSYSPHLEEAIGYDREYCADWQNLQASLSNLSFSHTFEGLKGRINQLSAATRNQGTGVFLGSILHEVYSENLQFTIWDRLSELQPRLIVVRDMCRWPEPPWDVREAVINAAHESATRQFPRHYDSFVKKWGNFNYRNAMHWLLKYRYRANWEYEMKEDYLILTPDLLVDSFMEHGYSPVHLEALSLPFIVDKWKEDFGLTWEFPTHVLAVFKNRRYK